MNPTDVEMQMQAHHDTAREESVKHLRSAVQALKHSEDDTAIAHMIDAVRLLGRAEAFLDVAKDVCEYLGADVP